jgi:hypothetical protein
VSLDLGRILATVDIESVQFDRKYVRLVRQFADLAPKAEQAACRHGEARHVPRGVGRHGRRRRGRY